jgi:hypothetical protein
MFDRRTCPRSPIDVLFNRFLDGYPYLCLGVDLSERGIQIETFSEPESKSDRFPLELRFPGDKQSLWVWARRLWRKGHREALEFVSMSGPARKRIERHLASSVG